MVQWFRQTRNQSGKASGKSPSSSQSRRCQWQCFQTIVGILGMVLTAHGGIENNNPGNIRSNAIHWEGATTNAGAFVTFSTPEYGIRAMAKILRTYNAQYGINTVSGIINRWAPPDENPTTNYISFVSRKVGKKPDEKIVETDFPALISAMIEFENGLNPYDSATILRGIKKE